MNLCRVNLLGWFFATISSGWISAQIVQVAVGVTPTCPYGLSACWAGAYEGLSQMEGVANVAKSPDTYNCMALVSLKENELPDTRKWTSQFKADVHESYIFRGVELTAEGSVVRKRAAMFLRMPGVTQDIMLRPLKHKLEWNFQKQSFRQPEEDESSAFTQLSIHSKTFSEGKLNVRLIGPFETSDDGSFLEVREFLVLSSDGKAEVDKQ